MLTSALIAITKHTCLSTKEWTKKTFFITQSVNKIRKIMSSTRKVDITGENLVK